MAGAQINPSHFDLSCHSSAEKSSGDSSCLHDGAQRPDHSIQILSKSAITDLLHLNSGLFLFLSITLPPLLQLCWMNTALFMPLGLCPHIVNSSQVDKLLYFLWHPVQMSTSPTTFSSNLQNYGLIYFCVSRTSDTDVYFSIYHAISSIFICSSSPLSRGLFEGKIRVLSRS